MDDVRYPQSPPHGTPPAPKPSTTLALTAILLAGVGAALAWVPFLGVLGLLMAVAGLVVGLVARRRVARGTADGRTMATWAVAVGTVGVLLGALGIALSVQLVHAQWQSTNPDAQVADEPDATDGEVVSGEVSARHQEILEAAVPTGLGAPGVVGPGTWTVTAVDLDARDQLVELTGQEPRVAGRPVLVTVRLENQGDGPWGVDASILLIGGDGRLYLDSCGLPHDRTVYAAGVLDPGSSHEVLLCYDVEPAAVNGAQLVVAVPYEDDARPAVWSLD